jgi:hypothetical protein
MLAGCEDTGTVESEIVVEIRDYYEPCSVEEVCPPDSECRTVTVDYGDLSASEDLCTLHCLYDEDCPLDGRCTNTSQRREDLSGGPLCYGRCSADVDCPDGLACTDFFNDMDPVCAPL